MNLDQLRNLELDINRGGDWPLAARIVLLALTLSMVVGAGWYLDTADQIAILDSERGKEHQLRQEFINKQRVVANIDAYRAQIKELEQMLSDMLKQLPTKTEMPNLLEDISNQGRANGLVFSQFRPLDEVSRSFYAAKPIQIKAQASYHQFGAFIGSVAALPRIVTLESVTMSGAAVRDFNRESAEPLTIEATLQTYRYTEDDNVAAAGSQR